MAARDTGTVTRKQYNAIMAAVGDYKNAKARELAVELQGYSQSRSSTSSSKP